MLCRILFCPYLALLPAVFNAGVIDNVQHLFDRDMQTLDLAQVKLEADRIIDLSIDVEVQLAVNNRLTAEVQAMLPPEANVWTKVEVLRR